MTLCPIIISTQKHKAEDLNSPIKVSREFQKKKKNSYSEFEEHDVVESLRLCAADNT